MLSVNGNIEFGYDFSFGDAELDYHGISVSDSEILLRETIAKGVD